MSLFRRRPLFWAFVISFSQQTLLLARYLLASPKNLRRLEQSRYLMARMILRLLIYVTVRSLSMHKLQDCSEPVSCCRMWAYQKTTQKVISESGADEIKLRVLYMLLYILRNPYT